MGSGPNGADLCPETLAFPVLAALNRMGAGEHNQWDRHRDGEPLGSLSLFVTLWLLMMAAMLLLGTGQTKLKLW
jgi:hypothetical protein